MLNMKLYRKNVVTNRKTIERALADCHGACCSEGRSDQHFDSAWKKTSVTCAAKYN